MAKTILVPTDFSSNAMIAAHYALRLTHDSADNVHILHAHFPLSLAFRTRPRNKVEEQRAEAKAKEDLLRFVETLGGISHGKISHSVVTANLVEAVQQHIADHPVSLVVMGTHGASGKGQNTIGSSTYDVVKSITTPLLVVPENTLDTEPRRVVFFTDYHEGDVNTLRGLQNILHGETAVQCTLVHILDGYKQPAQKDWQRMDDWKAHLEQETGWVGLATELVSGSERVEVVDQIIDTLDADLTLLTLVDRTGFFERLFHKSLARAIVLNPKTPVLLTTE